MTLTGRLAAIGGAIVGIAVVRQRRRDGARLRSLEQRMAAEQARRDEDERRRDAAEQARRNDEERRRDAAEQARRNEQERRRAVADQGIAILLLLAQARDWAARRVETVDFNDDTTVVRKASVDFRLPDYTPHQAESGGRTIYLVPLTWIKKGRRLKKFDIRAEDGKAISLIRTGHRDDLLIRGLIALGETVVFGEQAVDPRLDRDLEVDLATIVVGSPRDAEAIMSRLEAAQPGTQRYRLMHDEALPDNRSVFSVLLRRLRYNTIMIVRVDDDVDRQRIIKYCYEEPFGFGHHELRRDDLQEELDELEGEELGQRRRRRKKLTPRQRAEEYLGWRPVRTDFSAPAVQDAASYHLEVVAPPGVDITGAVLLAGRARDDKAQVRQDLQPGGVSRVHLLLREREVPPGAEGKAQVWLRPSPHEFLQALLAAVLIAVVLLLGAAWVGMSYSKLAPATATRQITAQGTVSSGQGDEQGNTAATLLLVLPAVLATLLVRPTEHAMASKLLQKARMQVILSCAIAYVAAATFVVASPNRGLRLWWVGFAVAAWLLVATISIGFWRQQRNPRKTLEEGLRSEQSPNP
jgi:hypothetical protein